MLCNTNNNDDDDDDGYDYEYNDNNNDARYRPPEILLGEPRYGVSADMYVCFLLLPLSNSCHVTLEKQF